MSTKQHLQLILSSIQKCLQSKLFWNLQDRGTAANIYVGQLTPLIRCLSRPMANENLGTKSVICLTGNNLRRKSISGLVRFGVERKRKKPF